MKNDAALKKTTFLGKMEACDVRKGFWML